MKTRVSRRSAPSIQRAEQTHLPSSIDHTAAQLHNGERMVSHRLGTEGSADEHYRFGTGARKNFMRAGIVNQVNLAEAIAACEGQLADGKAQKDAKAEVLAYLNSLKVEIPAVAAPSIEPADGGEGLEVKVDPADPYGHKVYAHLDQGPIDEESFI